jgi:site-specific DNA-methyltransferase (adenine-specific)
MARAPGSIRDAIIEFISVADRDVSLGEIREGIATKLGDVPSSSVRSYLNLNVPKIFERVGRGRYRLKKKQQSNVSKVEFLSFKEAKAQLFPADCFDWLAQREAASIHAVVTDPPYGVSEYTEKEQGKLRSGKGGIWRIPPSFDGHKRSPLPRFTVMDDEDRKELYVFFKRLGVALARVTVPGANIIVASNPLLAHIVASAMAESGLELRGHIARLTMTMRGGDRPKNAHHEFDGVSVMPRSMWEPWVVLRRPLEGRVQDNLRKWKTGGFRRPNKEQPFGDVIRSNPTAKAERQIAPHPSLKPQGFMRSVVRAILPLGEGVVLDPFAGSGSTLAAANAVGYESIGLEKDPKYFSMATKAIKKLSLLGEINPVGAELLHSRRA